MFICYVLSNSCTNLSCSLYAYMYMDVCAHTHTCADIQVLALLSTNNWFSFTKGIPPASGCAAAVGGTNCSNSGATATAAPPPLGKDSIMPAGECRPARGRASSHKGRILPIPKLLIVDYLLPALVMIRTAPQTGRRAGSPVVRLMSNWTSSLDAPITNKTSFIETSAQSSKTDYFWTWRIKNFSYTFCITVYKSWFVPFQNFRISPQIRLTKVSANSFI